MNFGEAVAAVLAIAGIILTIQRKRLCWIFNILSAGVYLKIFHDTSLPGQVTLQVLYIVLGIYGFIVWGKTTVIHPKYFGITRIILLSLLATVAAYPLWIAAPGVLYLDIFLAVLSCIATYLSARSFIENWHLWIGINVSSICLFLYKDLVLTAFLFLLYAILAHHGLKQWGQMRQPDKVGV